MWEWFEKVNQFIIKVSGIINKRWDDSMQNYIAAGWNTKFTPQKDGFAMIKVNPSESGGWISIAETTGEKFDVLKVARFGDTSGERTYWFAVRGGQEYIVYGDGSKGNYISFLYFRK